MVTVADCERVQARWFGVRAQLKGRTWVDEGHVWTDSPDDGVNLMFQTRASLGGDVPSLKDLPIGGALTFYIQVDDAEALYTELKDKVAILREPQTTFYGAREFDCRDCNGYILTFASDGG